MASKFKDLNKANQKQIRGQVLNKPLNKAILDAINHSLHFTLVDIEVSDVRKKGAGIQSVLLVDDGEIDVLVNRRLMELTSLPLRLL